MVMSGDGSSNLFNINSLEFPKGHLDDTERARRELQLGMFDIVLTNPPFGSDIPITDRYILEQYELARRWERAEDGKNFRQTSNLQAKVSPEVLFIERCIQWLKPGGRMGIVLPNGILGNPAAEYIRWWILQNTWVLASIELPVEVFIVDANVNILTSLLFLKKKYPDEILRGGLQEDAPYPIFMAVAENVGFDRRGNPRYKRNPDGSDIIVREPETETMRVRGRLVERTIVRPQRIPNNDLPVIAEKYHEFRKLYPEPGR
jgi:type I restriction enzyme M protein